MKPAFGTWSRALAEWSAPACPGQVAVCQKGVCLLLSNAAKNKLYKAGVKRHWNRCPGLADLG